MEPLGQNWLPAGKLAAVCFSIDDIHPAGATDAYEAGGELGAGALGRLANLQRRHPALKASLCVTPDWRLDSLVPDRPLRHVPWLNRHVHWTRLHAPDRFRLDLHPRLVRYLESLQRCEVVPHGLTHTHRGPDFAVEFQHQNQAECISIVERSLALFRAAGLRCARGYVPPAWNAPSALIAALDRLEFSFLASARDLDTPIAADAVTAASGLAGVSLIYPERLSARGLMHLSCNFQATSAYARALDILDLSGVLHIKAHVFKSGGGHTMCDGLDDTYCNYLDGLFSVIHKRYGERLWWAHLSEVAERAAHPS